MNNWKLTVTESDNNSISEQTESDNFRQDSKTIKIIIRAGLVIVVVGLLMVFNAGDQHPMVMVLGLLATAVGVFTSVIAKFYTWWKNG